MLKIAKYMRLGNSQQLDEKYQLENQHTGSRQLPQPPKSSLVKLRFVVQDEKETLGPSLDEST